MEEVLIVPSKSRLQLEAERLGSVEAVRDTFRSEDLWTRVYESHLAQQQNIERIVRAVGARNVIDRSLLPTKLHEYRNFAFVGGDNHFTYCSSVVLEYMRDHPSDYKVFGVVLDPAKSAGALLSYTVPEFIERLDGLGEQQLQRWTLLEGEVESEKCIHRLPLAIGDYFIGERDRFYMSRSLCSAEGKLVLPEKSSGVIIATGAGSGPGSWYANASGKSSGMRRDCRSATAFATEARSEHYALRDGTYMMIESYNDRDGLVVADSNEPESVPFPLGAKAAIRISSLTLPVATKSW